MNPKIVQDIKENILDYFEEGGLTTFEITNIQITEKLYMKTSICIHCKVSRSESHKVDKRVVEGIVLGVLIKNRVFVPNYNILVEEEETESISSAYTELLKSYKIKEENSMYSIPEIKKIHHSGDYTIIIWADDTKTQVKRAEGTPNDPYGAFAQAVLKKLFGSTEKAKFEHSLKQNSVKEQEKILSKKTARKEKQEKSEKKKLDREIKRQENELKKKAEQIEVLKMKRHKLFKRGE